LPDLTHLCLTRVYNHLFDVAISPCRANEVAGLGIRIPRRFSKFRLASSRFASFLRCAPSAAPSLGGRSHQWPSWCSFADSFVRRLRPPARRSCDAAYRFSLTGLLPAAPWAQRLMTSKLFHEPNGRPQTSTRGFSLSYAVPVPHLVVRPSLRQGQPLFVAPISSPFIPRSTSSVTFTPPWSLPSGSWPLSLLSSVPPRSLSPHGICVLSKAPAPRTKEHTPEFLVTDEILCPVSPLRPVPPIQTVVVAPGICILFCSLLSLINRNLSSSQSGATGSANCSGSPHRPCHPSLWLVCPP
jgi:hypothetical protein